MSKVKIINNEIVYSSNFMFIESEGNWVTNPTEEQLSKEGFKELVEEFSDVTEISYEERSEFIVRLLPLPEDLGQDVIDAIKSGQAPSDINSIDTEVEYDAASVTQKKSIFNWFTKIFK